MACRIDDQNKLSLISVSFPANSVFVWDLAEQLKFPRRHFRLGFLDLEKNFSRILSMSQRKGEYFLIDSRGRVDRFRLPRRFQKIQELAQLSKAQELRPNSRKYLSTAGKNKIDRIGQFFKKNKCNFSELEPLDLFELPGFSEVIIEQLESQNVAHLGLEDYLEKICPGEIKMDPVEVVIDEPFEECVLLAVQSRVVWLQKDSLARKGEFDFGFEVVQSGKLQSNSGTYFWVLLGICFLRFYLG